MPYNVTSWFVDQGFSRNPPVKRTFTIGSSDYSERVLRWPSFRQQWDDLRPVTLTVAMANEDQALNFFRTNKTTIRTSCTFKFGYTHATSGDELITLFVGDVLRVQFDKAEVQLTLVDKISQLAERVVGVDVKSPAVMTGTNQLPSDIAWWLITSYGGMSSIQSTNNPDINWSDFQAWASVFSVDNVQMHCIAGGKKVLEVMRSLMRHSRSAVFMKEDKISFARYSNVNTNITSLNPDHFTGVKVSIEEADIINKQYVNAGYIPSSKNWGITVWDARTSSINSYGLRENVEKDETLWYVTSNDAANLAQRIIFSAGDPYDQVEINCLLQPLHALIGETLVVNDPHTGITEGWRIMERGFNMEDGTMTFKIDGSQITTPFVLDVSALDGNDVML